ncbi:MAG: hypothetical protein R6X22_00725, partial [Gemmatimonadota bacterium]
AVGRVTHALAKLQAGDRIGVRGPYGRGWPIVPQCPALDTDASTNVTTGDLPSDLSYEGSENDTDLQVYLEFAGALAENLNVDEPGAGNDYFPAGSNVCVYYAHFDQTGDARTEVSGTIVFDDDVLALIKSGSIYDNGYPYEYMFDADPIVGNPSTTYPQISGGVGDRNRGLEFDRNSPDDDTVIFAGGTVTFTNVITTAIDSYRLVFQANY